MESKIMNLIKEAHENIEMAKYYLSSINKLDARNAEKYLDKAQTALDGLESYSRKE